MNANETIELIDLEPEREVVGGACVQAGFGYAVLTVSGTRPGTPVSERTSNLTYSGESGGLNE